MDSDLVKLYQVETKRIKEIDEAFQLLNQILRETKDIDKNFIGFRPT